MGEPPPAGSMEEQASGSESVSPSYSTGQSGLKGNDLLVIRFKDITVTANYTESVPSYETFGKKLLGCFCGPCIKVASPKAESAKIELLKNVSGFVMPGTMTLLLGPPGSGKSALLRVLEGKLQKDKSVRQEGTVLYNENILTSQIAPTKPIAYITEPRNVHLPVFTVRETLEFVQECMRGSTLLSETKPSSGSANSYLEYILQSFGLKGIENQKVGTPANGIRDGERTRLTIAEVAMGTHSVVLFDHPSSGQDSLLTYDIVSTLRSLLQLHQAAGVMALVQVAPEFYNLFDRIILLSEGQVIFQGPPHIAESYFNELGFRKPSHIDTGTFLLDIAAGDGAGYMDAGHKFLSIPDLVGCYESSQHHMDVLRIVSSEPVVTTFWAQAESEVEVSLRETNQGADVLVTHCPHLSRSNSIAAGDKITGFCTPSGEVQYIGGSQRIEAEKVAKILDRPLPERSLSLQVERRLNAHGDNACYEKEFGWKEIRKWFLVTRTLIKRQAKFAVRLRQLLLLRLLQVTIVGLFVGTLFYRKGGRVDQSEMNSVRAIGFVSIMHLLLVNIIQLPVHLMVHRPVFYKQRAQHLFGVSSYIVAHGVVNLPQAALEAFIYSMCVYFFAHLSRETAAHYFQYWAMLFLIAYLGSWYMVLVSAVAPILEVATSLAGFLVVLNLLFSGFPVVLSVMKPYWKWMLYVMPSRWGNVIFSSTQFDNRYNVPCSSHLTFVFCLRYPRRSVGDAFLKFYDLKGGTRALVLAYSVIILFTLGVAILSYLAYRRIEIVDARPSVPRERYTVVVPQASPSPKDLGTAEDGGVQDDMKWITNLPIEPVILTFQNLTLVRKDRNGQGEVTVLDNVSGYVKPGKMLAVVGNMHSGKKTLLGCISGRAPPGRLEGDILLNGSTLQVSSFCRISGFVDKLEKHQPFLTVKETVEFSANLRLPRRITSSEKANHVESVMELMGLSKLSNHLVGTLRQTVARVDEKYKRLTIAVELAANPSILYLEDPTYRLDALSTRRILTQLQKVAWGGRTLISTLDHPSGEALSLFDSVLILKLGGRVVYFGPLGPNSNLMLGYFGSVPDVPAFDGHFSPLTYVLDIVGDGGIKQRQAVKDFVSLYQQSQLHKSTMEEISLLVQQQRQGKEEAVVDEKLRLTKHRYPASYRMQIAMVFTRNQRVLYRNVLYTFSRLVATIAAGLLMGTIFLQMKLTRMRTMSAASILPYMQAILISGLISNNVILQLGTDKEVYRRENRARMYAPILYPLSWAVAELPYLLLSTLVFVAISNSIAGVGVGSTVVFVKYWMCLFLFSVAVTYYGILVTLVAHHPLLAVSIVSITTSIWIGGSGVSVPRPKAQLYRWLYWVDPFQYVVNILTSAAFYCDTASPPCRACRLGYHDCRGCGCHRLLDVEAQQLRLGGNSSRPAVFVWDRLATSRVIERNRNGKDAVALCVAVLLFAALSLVVFRLRHRRQRR